MRLTSLKKSLPALILGYCAVGGHAWAIDVGSAEIPLRIGDKSFDPNRGTVRFSITNTSDHIVTAWGFSFMASGATGPELILDSTDDTFLTPGLDEAVRRVRSGEPFLESYGPLAPGSRREYERSFELNGPARFRVVSVEVACAVFDDGTSIGSPHLLAGIFASRAGALEASDRVLEILASLTTADPNAVETLSRELARLEQATVEEIGIEEMAEPPSTRLGTLFRRLAYLRSVEGSVSSISEAARSKSVPSADYLDALRRKLTSERRSSLSLVETR